MANIYKNKILIVDDNPHIINKVVDILSNHNEDYIFYQANNGEVAFKIAESKLPELIITDWDMPKVNGIELIVNLKKNQKTTEIPVIMATAVMQSSEDLKMALKAGLMNLPWTYAGLPAITIPAGKSKDNLPIGLQITGSFNKDEELIAFAKLIESSIS